MALINVPLPGQTLSSSRSQIQNNFSVIDTAFGVDHAAYGSANEGWHDRVTFPRQAASPVASGTTVILGSALSAINNETELFVRRQAGTTVPAGAQSVAFTAALFGSKGGTRLPSGIALQWERGVQFNAGSSKTITLNTGGGLPVFTVIYNVQITITDTNGTYVIPVIISNITFPSFTVQAAGTIVQPPNTVTIGYLVIGA